MSINESNGSLSADENEEKAIKDRLEEVDFATRMRVKNSMEKSKNIRKKVNKERILSELGKINKNKGRNEPKEYSAVLKPKVVFKGRDKSKGSLLGNKFTRDPRFDDLSGNLNSEKFNSNYKFVKDMANNYLEKLNKTKNNKKYKNKLTDAQYELLKKQKNFVSGWINKQKQNDKKTMLKKEINQENKERILQGKKKLYVKENKLNKYLNKT